MRKIWAKSILLGSGIITMMGINTPLVHATAQHNTQIAEVRQTTPLYLRLYTGLPSNSDKQECNTKLAQHFSHGSHGSHHSHHSHHSHFSSN